MQITSKASDIKDCVRRNGKLEYFSKLNHFSWHNINGTLISKEYQHVAWKFVNHICVLP